MRDDDENENENITKIKRKETAVGRRRIKRAKYVVVADYSDVYNKRTSDRAQTDGQLTRGVDDGSV